MITKNEVSGIKWSADHHGYICTQCNSVFSPEELTRVFKFDEPVPSNFTKKYCSECGVLWDYCEKEVTDNNIGSIPDDE